MWTKRLFKQGYNKYLPNDTVYAKSKQLDYPSVGQLRDVFRENKIQTIFAVTEAVYPLYRVNIFQCLKILNYL